MVFFHEHPGSVAHVENEFVRHIPVLTAVLLMPTQSTQMVTRFCHKCHYRTHGDGTPSIHNHTMSAVELQGSATRLAARKISEKTAELFKTYKDGQVLRHYYYDVDGKLLGAKVRTKDKEFRCEGEVKTLFGMQNFRHKTTSKQKKLVITEGEMDAMACLRGTTLGRGQHS